MNTNIGIGNTQETYLYTVYKVLDYLTVSKNLAPSGYHTCHGVLNKDFRGYCPPPYKHSSSHGTCLEDHNALGQSELGSFLAKGQGT